LSEDAEFDKRILKQRGEIARWRANFDADFAKYKAAVVAPSNDDIQANDVVFLWELGIRVD
jgi:hypothetical protein